MTKRKKDHSKRLYLRFVPVEAVAFVGADGGLVALMLGELRSVIEDFLSLELIARHLLYQEAHSVSQHVSDLNKKLKKTKKKKQHTKSQSVLKAVTQDLEQTNFIHTSLLFTLRWLSICLSRVLATLISLEDIIFLFRMARGTSGLGVRSTSLTRGVDI